MDTRAITLVFHVDHYVDGHGDLGNMIDVSTEVINRLNKKGISVDPYFVIASLAEANKNLVNRLIANVPFKINAENVYTFDANQDEDNFSRLIDDNPCIQEAYLKADGIFIISTPFPNFKQTLENKKLLKKDVLSITITEHDASSYDHVSEKESQPLINYFVTGVGENQSGLMVSDKKIAPAEALLAISDESYFKKLGIDKSTLDINKANEFLKKTLIVPVYMHSKNNTVLPFWIFIISHSDLAKNYEKVIFHTNYYDKEHFDYHQGELKSSGDFLLIYEHRANESKPYELIVGHFFSDQKDFLRLCQISPFSLIAGDKALETAISASSVPLYIRPVFKKHAGENFLNLVKDDANLHALFSWASKNDSQLCNMIYEHCAREVLPRNEKRIFSLLNLNVIQTWNEVYRKKLLDTAFWKILDKEIIPKLERVSQQPSENQSMIAKDIFSPFVTQKNTKQERLCKQITLQIEKYRKLLRGERNSILGVSQINTKVWMDKIAVLQKANEILANADDLSENKLEEFMDCENTHPGWKDAETRELITQFKELKGMSKNFNILGFRL